MVISSPWQQTSHQDAECKHHEHRQRVRGLEFLVNRFEELLKLALEIRYFG
jgi:hypothetical protein